VLGALIVREVPVLEDAVNGVLAYARQGTGLVVVVVVTVANAAAEELFFARALGRRAGPGGAARDDHRVRAHLDRFRQPHADRRRASPRRAHRPGAPGRGGVLAPALTHVTWSVAMLPVLPPLFG
jgi:CAAX protease family protein